MACLRPAAPLSSAGGPPCPFPGHAWRGPGRALALAALVILTPVAAGGALAGDAGADLPAPLFAAPPAPDNPFFHDLRSLAAPALPVAPPASAGAAGDPGRRPEASAATTPRARLALQGATGSSDFSSRLMGMMEREALRYRRTEVGYEAGAAAFDDSWAEERRAREAERIVTRAFNKTFDAELERMVRSTPRLGAALERIETLIGRGPKVQGREDAAHAGVGSGFKGSVGLRLDAHPRLILRTEFLGLRGRIEVPARDEPTRLTLEHPLGPRSRAVLSAGLWRDRDWATVSFNLSF